MLISLASFFTGIFSGMGVGGGSLLVPVLIFLFDVAQRLAQGASLGAFLLTGLVATVTHLRRGNVVLRLSIPLAAGSLAGAFLGAQLAHVAPPLVLRRVFAAYLLAVATYALLVRVPDGDHPPP